MRRWTLIVLVTLAACGVDDTRPIATTAPVAFIGDSITSEWPLEDYVEGAINAGVSAEETPQMLARFDVDVLSRHPAVVVIHGGINDIRHRESGDVSSLIEMAQRSRAANIKVIMGTVMMAENLGTNADVKRDLIRAMNRDIRAASTSYGFAVVDYYAVTAKKDGSLDESLFSDGLHPNHAGYQAMWRELLPVLRSTGVVVAAR